MSYQDSFKGNMGRLPLSASRGKTCNIRFHDSLVKLGRLVEHDPFLCRVLAKDVEKLREAIGYITRTLRICTSVAGQMTSILTSFSLLSPSHPKNHAYCEKREFDVLKT